MQPARELSPRTTFIQQGQQLIPAQQMLTPVGPDAMLPAGLSQGAQQPILNVSTPRFFSSSSSVLSLPCPKACHNVKPLTWDAQINRNPGKGREREWKIHALFTLILYFVDGKSSFNDMASRLETGTRLIFRHICLGHWINANVEGIAGCLELSRPSQSTIRRPPRRV